MIALRALFQDIIENEDIKLDDMFIASLVHDLIKVSIYFYIRILERDVEGIVVKKYIYFLFLLFRVCCTFTSHLY